MRNINKCLTTENKKFIEDLFTKNIKLTTIAEVIKKIQQLPLKELK